MRGNPQENRTHTIKAVRIHNFGGLEVMEYEDAPRPQLGSGEVLIRIYAVGVNPPLEASGQLPQATRSEQTPANPRLGPTRSN